VGVVYEAGDPAARKFPGRTVYNASPVSALAVDNVLFVSPGTDRLLAHSDDTIYSSNPTTGTFSSLWTLPGHGSSTDSTVLFDHGYVVAGYQSGAVAPFGAFAMRNTTAYRMGLAPVFTPPICALIAGSLTGSFSYWTTEYDNTNSVESAFDFTPNVVGFGTAGMSPIAQGVRVNRPNVVNASATHWRIFRTINGGSPLVGWLVAQVAIATLTFDDSVADADLVTHDPYRIVTINGISESMDRDPQDLSITSICSFEGSLVGVTNVGGDLAYTPEGEPHSWPDSYRIIFPTLFSGRSTCARKCGDVVYGATAMETFRVNYLPDEKDNIFSTDIAVEHIANYGTPSPQGMCTFTAWGGAPILFVASLQGPIIISGKVVDRAVRNIDWPNTVVLSKLLFCKVFDNPSKFRVELQYRDSVTDSTSWKCLHFYYDGERTERADGPLPEMAWTGPHPVPGPGTYGIVNYTPTTWTGSKAATGTVYTEGQGTSDAANLTDGSGTIPFRLRTRKNYPLGLDGQGRADRLFINKATGTAQDYTVTLNAHQENGQDTAYGNLTIKGDASGNSSIGLNANLVSFDVEVVADGISGMAPINSINLRLEEPALSQKTQVVNG
jgi:hypothetical protein